MLLRGDCVAQKALIPLAKCSYDTAGEYKIAGKVVPDGNWWCLDNIVPYSLEGFEWIGCEMTEDYWPIIEARVKWAELQPKTLL